mmetsp:Transcript_77357/g.173150  ORF Transcript_77357/g.173150 Transcript_77357/m.173150 type:complete len:243 (-) Transcript_77357:270-998(-)
MQEVREHRQCGAVADGQGRSDILGLGALARGLRHGLRATDCMCDLPAAPLEGWLVARLHPTCDLIQHVDHPLALLDAVAEEVHALAQRVRLRLDAEQILAQCRALQLRATLHKLVASQRPGADATEHCEELGGTVYGDVKRAQSPEDLRIGDGLQEFFVLNDPAVVPVNLHEDFYQAFELRFLVREGKIVAACLSALGGHADVLHDDADHDVDNAVVGDQQERGEEVHHVVLLVDDMPHDAA